MVVQEKHPPAVTCIVLNWNGWRDTAACLASLAECRYPRLAVIVVDNGSTDGSPGRIRELYPETQLIVNPDNLGFAGGCNVGITAALAAGAQYVWLLNNDTTVCPGTLTALVELAESDSRAGAVGSVMRYAHDSRRVQAWGGGKVNLWTGRTRHAREPVEDAWFDYLTAASILIRRDAIEQVGLLDDGFFLYWEDTDYSYRLRAAGWRLRVASGAAVLHKEHASTGRNARILDRYTVASGIRFLLKHSPRPGLSLILFFSLKIGWRVVTGRFASIGDVAAGARDHFRAGKLRAIASHAIEQSR